MPGADVQPLLLPFTLPPVSQICLVVRDIPSAMHTASALMNVRKWYRSRTLSRETTYRGERVDMDADIVVGYSGRMQVELFQPLAGKANVYYEVFGENGGGFHHTGIMVRNIGRVLDDLSGSGLAVSQQSRMVNHGGAVIRTAFLDTRAWCGSYVELIEVRMKGVSVGMPKWLMALGAVLGSSERL